MKKLLLFSLAIGICQLAFSQWIQQGSDIDGEAPDDYSGGAISISANGSIVAIGARLNDGNGDLSGHVRVYQFNGADWVQLGLDINGEVAGDRSGNAVSLSADGSIVAIGARFNDGNGNDSGHVRVFQFDGVSWNQIGQDIDGEAADDWSGSRVSLNADGTIVAIGASFNGGNGADSGHVRVFQFNGVNWTQIGQDIDGEAAGDRASNPVLNADGTILAIGAALNDGNGNDSGHVRVFQFDGVNWNQIGQDINGEAANDYSGIAVSLSADGSIVAIGASDNDGNGANSGHARVYQFDGVNWNQIGQDIDGEATADSFGYSVSLSSDGTILAIGARDNDGNGNEAGHVRLYEFDGVNWNQLGQDLDGEAAFDHFYHVSLSAFGSVVAIGAQNNDGNGFSSGHVRIYNYQEITLIPDPNFEQALIDQGIDSQGILNGYVFTADISGITNLIISGLNIADLTGIEDFAALQTLLCNNNSISQANFSNNRALSTLNISNNVLASLNVNRTNLQELWCNGNLLTALDIIDLGSLETLYCHDNLLTGLEVGDLSDLQLLHCYNNQLTGSLALDELFDLLDFDAANNPGLVCIQVREPEEATAQKESYANWFKDPATVYSHNCNGGMMAKSAGNLTVSDLETISVTVHPNPTDAAFFISVAEQEDVTETILYTMQGKEVLRTKSSTIYTAALPAGLYIAEIKTPEHKKVIKKVIISRD